MRKNPSQATKKPKSLRYILVVTLLSCFLILLSLFPIGNPYGPPELKINRPLIQRLQVAVPTPAPYPVKSTGLPLPQLSAKGAVVVDVNSGKVLFEKDSNQRLYPASTTKIMTALITLEHYSLDLVLTNHRDKVEGSALGLKVGERMSVLDLLKAAMISSSNDAAAVLADNYPGGEKEFVNRMNQKAKELYMLNTNFINPTGLHHPDHYSTPKDLARLGAAALNNPTLKRIVGTKKTTIFNQTTGLAITIENLNQLLDTAGTDGIKTGFTDEAGECLVATRVVGRNRVISVVLKSEDRFGETEKLLSYIFGSYRW